MIATFIARLIQDNGLNQENAMAEGRSETIANIFEQYEQIRRSFVDQVQAATMTSSQWTQQQWDDFNEILHRRVYPSSATLGELG